MKDGSGREELPAAACPASAGEAVLAALGAAVVVTDLAGTILHWNAAAERLYGYTEADMLGKRVQDHLVGPRDQSVGEAIMAMVLSGQRWEGEFPVRCADGTMRRMRVTDTPLWDQGAVVGVVGVGLEVSGEVADAAAVVLTDRLDRLSQAIAELAGACEIADVNAVVLSHAAAAVGAVVASVSVVEDDERTLRLVGISGARAGAQTRWSTYPVAAEVPSSEAVRTRAPVLLGGEPGEIENRYPLLTGQVPDRRALVCLPLIAGDACLGVISLSFEGSRLPDERELTFLTTLADACAQALDRIRAQRDATDRATKLAFLAEASIEFASSLDYRTTLANVARLAVPTLADWCSVQIVEDGRLLTLAVAHVDPAK
ncbi:MAG: PAS domain S-box protein, partial [Propionibacteriales bacterium]|nr:PAS domain S-box protein [Propionibacteriales bacterium]